MAQLKLKTKPEILKTMEATVKTDTPLTDINPGSVISTLLLAAANEDFEQQYQIASLLKLLNIDNLNTEDLETKAFEYGLFRKSAFSSTGNVTIKRVPVSGGLAETSVVKSGQAPRVGDQEITVTGGIDEAKDDLGGVIYTFGGKSSDFSIIVGSNVDNYEMVMVNDITKIGTDFKFTLVAPLTKNHDLGTPIYAQSGKEFQLFDGDTFSVTLSSGEQVIFTVSGNYTLLSGQSELGGINVNCQSVGVIGNIKQEEITTASYTGAGDTDGIIIKNKEAFTNGKDEETDDELRDRVKNFAQGVGRGTKDAILGALTQVQDVRKGSKKRIVSATLINPPGGDVDIYIDDGTGYKAEEVAVNDEEVLLVAEGDETELQLKNHPVVYPYIETGGLGPFNVTDSNKTLDFRCVFFQTR